MSVICPLCGSGHLVEMSEVLIRDTDTVLHENEDYKHVLRGKIEILVHTKANIQAEKEESRLLEVA